MSQTSDVFYQRFDDHPVAEAPTDWQLGENGAQALVLKNNESIHEGFEATAYRQSRPVKVADPIPLDRFQLDGEVVVERDRLYCDGNQTSHVKSFPINSPTEVHVNNPTLFINDPFPAQSVELESFTGALPGTYQANRRRESASPHLQDVAYYTVQDNLRVQGNGYCSITESYQFGLGYRPFPNSSIYGDYVLTSPETIAYGLFLAIAEGDDANIAKQLNQLADFYLERVDGAKVNGQYQAQSDDVNPGFPHKIHRWQRQPDSNVLLAENALLGIAICQAVAYLSDRPEANRYRLTGEADLGDRVRFVIDQLVLLITASTEQGNQFSSATLSRDGYFLADESLEASFLASIFLAQALQTDYSLTAHTTAANLYLKMADLPSVPADQLQGLGIEDQHRPRAIAAQILWFIYFAQSDADTPAIIANLAATLRDWDIRNVKTTSGNLATVKSGEKQNVVLVRDKEDIDYSANNDLVHFLQGFIQAAYPEFRYPNGKTIKEQPIKPFPVQGVDGLYRSKDGFPRLTNQCEMALTEADYSFFTAVPAFPLMAEEAILSVWQLFEEAVRILPEGQRWFQREALRRPDSAIASLVMASARTAFSNFLRYWLIEIGRDPGSAVGFVLGKYARVFLEKPLLASDTYWNQVLNAYLTASNSDYSAIQQSVEAIVDDGFILQTPDVYSYYVYDLQGQTEAREFDPNRDEDLFDLSFNEELQEAISANSDYRINEADVLTTGSQDLIVDVLNEPIYSPLESLDKPERRVDPGELVGYVESESETARSPKLAEDYMPAGVHYRRAHIATYFDSTRRGDRESGIVTHYLPRQPLSLTVGAGSFCRHRPSNQVLLVTEDTDQVTASYNQSGLKVVVRNDQIVDNGEPVIVDYSDGIKYLTHY